jgi:predicted cupin superfamily sugar epimerase
MNTDSSHRNRKRDFMHDMNAIIDALKLEPHPEGGFYREMYRSGVRISDSSLAGNKSAHTSIYYLLSGKDFSAWHRIKSDETWYFHLGCDLLIFYIDKSKMVRTVRIGMESKSFQATIPANIWFAAKPLNEDAYCLVSCAVAPGFEFEDFEMGKRDALLKEFGITAENTQMIEALTRVD